MGPGVFRDYLQNEQKKLGRSGASGRRWDSFPESRLPRHGVCRVRRCGRGRRRSTRTTTAVLEQAVEGIPRSSCPHWGPTSASLSHPVAGGPSRSRAFTFKPTHTHPCPRKP